MTPFVVSLANHDRKEGIVATDRQCSTQARAKLEAEYSHFVHQAEQNGMGDFATNLFFYDGITRDRIDIVEFALEKRFFVFVF